jgi:ABC-type glycerol-3-phosphate transport system substrate-binding protein
MSAAKRGLSRRSLLLFGAGALGAAGLAACGATPTPQVIKEVVTQVVEKEVTKIVEGTPQVVKETVVVENTVVVEKTVPVTLAPTPTEVRIACYTISDSWNKTVEGVYAAFMEKNPSIKVKNEWRPGQDYWTKIQTEFAAGTAPDVTVNQVTTLPTELGSFPEHVRRNRPRSPLAAPSGPVRPLSTECCTRHSHRGQV